MARVGVKRVLLIPIKCPWSYRQHIPRSQYPKVRTAHRESAARMSSGLFLGCYTFLDILCVILHLTRKAESKVCLALSRPPLFKRPGVSTCVSGTIIPPLNTLVHIFGSNMSTFFSFPDSIRSHSWCLSLSSFPSPPTFIACL